MISRRSFNILAGGGRVLGPSGAYGKIIVEEDRFRVASRAVARDYYMNIGTISDDFQVKIVNRANRRLGEVEEGFLASLAARTRRSPSAAGPLCWTGCIRLLQWYGQLQGERVQTPRWMGPKMPLTAQLADEERRLRRELRHAWDAGGRKGLLRTCY